MAKIIVKMDAKGCAALLKGVEVRADLQARADRIAMAAGSGMEAKVVIGRSRALASITAVSPIAMAAEANDRALTKALDAGR